jgi:LysR family transcriptional regulator, hca operon transcriptional activator
MEFRHLRYFVAVAEAGSLKLAAEEKLHTTQPSLSRQIRDLEHEVGTPLFLRRARGVELTAAGRVFLDHARVVLSQAEAALRSVRETTKPNFALGFMIGHDSTWIPKALSVLHDKLPEIHVVISTQSSPQLAAALSQGLIDVGFLRQEDGGPGLEYLLLGEEPLEIYLPKDHPLAESNAISLQEVAGETFLSISGTALSASGRPPALRLAIDRYLKKSGVNIKPSHEVDNLGGVMSLIVSTGGVALLPAYAKTFLPSSVTTRPLRGFTPKIDLSVGYREANDSPVLRLFLSRIKEQAMDRGTLPPSNGEHSTSDAPAPNTPL